MMSAVMARTPCPTCPFRKDRPIYLRRDRRVEIAEALLSGQSFHCHKTVDYSNEDAGDEVEPDTTGALLCAGAEKSLLSVGLSSQMGRIAERLGLADLDKQQARGVEVWDIHEWQTLAEGSTGDNPIDDYVETCNTVNPGCIAPAGFAVGRVVSLMAPSLPIVSASPVASRCAVSASMMRASAGTARRSTSDV